MDLRDKEQRLAAHLSALETALVDHDASFIVADTSRSSLLTRLDEETDEDRSWHDFSDDSFEWAMNGVCPDIAEETKATLRARARLQAEIDRIDVELSNVRGEIAQKDPTSLVDAMIFDVLGLFGLERPGTR